MVKTNSLDIEIGTSLPNFELINANSLNNEKFSFSDLDDRHLFLMFICAHCPFVKHLEKQITELYMDFQDNVQIIAISSNDINTHPADSPENLINQAPIQDNCSYIVGNCIDLPFESESFDYAMSIAVIHHLSTESRRLQALQEINRILKTGGEALIYVWAYEQPRFENETTQDVNVKWMLQKKYSEKKENDEIFYRYYHLFKKNELETLISRINTLEIIETGNQYNNWYCVVKKILN